MSNVHRKEKSVSSNKCKVCGKTFQYAFSMRRHLNMHLRQKPRSALSNSTAVSEDMNAGAVIFSKETIKSLESDNDNKSLHGDYQKSDPEAEKKLEIEFGQNNYPVKNRRIELGKEVGMSEDEVTVWFQRRRAADRGMKKSGVMVTKIRGKEGPKTPIWPENNLQGPTGVTVRKIEEETKDDDDEQSPKVLSLNKWLQDVQVQHQNTGVSSEEEKQGTCKSGGGKSAGNLTPEQRQRLQHEFQANPNPSMDNLSNLSFDLELPFTKVSKYFSEARYEAKKEVASKQTKVESCEVPTKSQDSLIVASKNNNFSDEQQSGVNSQTTPKRLTEEQYQTLRDEFKTNQRPSPERLRKLAESMSVPAKKISKWFQDARYLPKRLARLGREPPKMEQESPRAKEPVDPQNPESQKEPEHSSKEQPQHQVTPDLIKDLPPVTKGRWKGTPEQREKLEFEFSRDRMPSRPKKIQLAEEFGLAVRKIDIWFMNRRQKEKTKGGNPTQDQGDTEDATGRDIEPLSEVEASVDRRSIIGDDPSKAGEEETKGSASRTTKRTNQDPIPASRAKRTKSLAEERSDGRPHKCTDCGKGFLKRSQLKSHIRFVHLRTDEIRCQLCDKLFTRKCNMAKHVDLIHFGNRNHACDFCDQKFGSKNNLEQHVSRHHVKVVNDEANATI